jgi:hypothetical protein
MGRAVETESEGILEKRMGELGQKYFRLAAVMEGASAKEVSQPWGQTLLQCAFLNQGNKLFADVAAGWHLFERSALSVPVRYIALCLVVVYESEPHVRLEQFTR